MPKTCCAPGCKIGYLSNEKDKGKLSLFRIPKEKSRRELWLRSIPRSWDGWDENTLKTTELLVCEKHFNDSDFKTIREDGHSTRKRTNEGKQLRRRSLKNDAVPSKWPNVPNYVSKIISTSRPTTTATSTAREAAEVD